MNTLMMMDVVGRLPPLSIAYMCCSGSRGYGVMMEVLEGGLTTHLLLATNVDVRDITDSMGNHHPTATPTSSFPPLSAGLPRQPSSDIGYTSDNDNTATTTTTHPSPPTAVVSFIHSTMNTDPVWGGTTIPPWSKIIPPTSSFRHVNILGRPCGTSLSLLCLCTGLQSVSLDGFCSAVKVDRSFLTGCQGLTSIDLSPLSNVTLIEASFMFGCTSLKRIDLTPFRKVTTIHRSFLQKCSSLEEIDLSPLDENSTITDVGWMFLSGCTGLKSVNIALLRNSSTHADWSLLDGCSGLTTIDLSPLANITSIGHSFLANCSGLTDLDLSPLSSITSIRNSFLEGCSGLREVDLGPLSSVTTIGRMFMYRCTGLERIDLTPLANVTTMGTPVFGAFGDAIPEIYGTLNHVIRAALV